jgi:transcriptional regulator with XRE-family HTH domain
MSDINIEPRALRDSRGETQQGIGEALEVSRSTVRGWESGRRLPDLRRFVALSDHFGLSPARMAQLARWFASRPPDGQ